MAFFNMSSGDAPIFKALADQYTLSDNFHQSIMGGSVTGAIGSPMATTPSTATATAIRWSAGQYHDPDPVAGTVNTYQSNGTWVNCSDPNQPGVAEIQYYLASLPYPCRPELRAECLLRHPRRRCALHSERHARRGQNHDDGAANAAAYRR